MKRYGIIAILIGLAAILSSCTGGVTVLNTETPTESIPTAVDTDYWEQKLVNETWLSPGTVEIGNFHAGAEADWNLRIHWNGDKTQDIFRVTTDPGETRAPIKLTKKPYEGGLSSIVLKSDNPADRLKAVGIEGDSVVIDGFTGNATRILIIEYHYIATFEVGYYPPTRVRDGYSLPPDNIKDWVIIADPAPLFYPLETKEVLVTLSIPKNTEVTARPIWYLTDKGKEAVKLLVDSDTDARSRFLRILAEHPMLEITKFPLAGDNIPEETTKELIKEGIVAVSDINKWEFWLNARETSASGTVQTQTISRWLVAMR